MEPADPGEGAGDGRASDPQSTAPRIGGRGRLWGGTATAHPAAFLIVPAYAALWALLDRESLDWHGAATLATPASRGRLWLMTLFIQRAEHRDTQAIQAKLDELLRANRDAENAITRVDETEPKEIEDFRGGSGGGFDSSMPLRGSRR